jgi:preprotein translocase subunit YajC
VGLFLVIGAIFYFLLIRPQKKKQKEHREMMGNLKKDDKVLTAGGIYGLVVGIHEDTIILKLADNVKVEFSRGAISKVFKSS